MHAELKSRVIKQFNALDLQEIETVQKLWSDYGSIKRYQLIGTVPAQVIIKHIIHKPAEDHPRGWNTEKSHQRKLKSYQVEQNWYVHFANECDDQCRIATCYLHEEKEGEQYLVLEDLDLAGYPIRKVSLSPNKTKAVIAWLANFHAQFLGRKPEGLWDRGTYWHLDTRPEEWKAMKPGKLKEAASKIDKKLKEAQFQTWVHGDAKLANFCFSEDLDSVAAVDFQYVGEGCGMQDLCYFLGSALNSEECEKHAGTLLDFYFLVLKEALIKRNIEVEYNKLEKEWRSLFEVAWTDFSRFLLGWMPDHQKLNSYSLELQQKCLERL